MNKTILMKTETAQTMLSENALPEQDMNIYLKISN